MEEYNIQSENKALDFKHSVYREWRTGCRWQRSDRQEGQIEAANLPWHVAIEIWEEQTPKDAFSLSV